MKKKKRSATKNKPIIRSSAASKNIEILTEKQTATWVGHVFALLCLGVGALVWVHQYIDSKQGMLGLAIESVTVGTFGALGFAALPFCLLITAAFAVITKKRILTQIFVSFLTYIVVTQLLFKMVSRKSFDLIQLGHLGQSLRSNMILVFGQTGSAICLSVIALVMYAWFLELPVLRVLRPFKLLGKPFMFLGDWLKVFIQKSVEAYRQSHPVGSSQEWLIKALFFRKVQASKQDRRPSKELSALLDPIEIPVQTKKEIQEAPIFNMDEIALPDLPSKDIQGESVESVGKEATLEERLEQLHGSVDEVMPEEVSDGLDDCMDIGSDQIDPGVCTPVDADGSPNMAEERSASFEGFQCPPIELLEKGQKPRQSMKAMTKLRVEKAAILEETLASFNVKAKVVNITPGPSVTRYELQPGDGVKISKITALSKDISLKLAAPDIRIEAPIPGKALVGIEVPNDDVQLITLRSIMEESSFFDSPQKLLAGLGKTITGDSIIMNLAKMPHVLIAGATGSGKSVCINTIILSILMKATPEDVKFLMIDPKKVELSLYEGIPHLIAPVVTDPNRAAATLKKWALVEMENRYETFSRVGVKDIAGFNEYVAKELKENPDATLPNSGHALEKLPFIVVIIDELADLMMVASQDVEQTICRLAQMARATGIHLVIATQRPSVNVVTGLIKANVPSRVSFYLQSQIDSRTILDMAGAEKLLGKGDMLYSPVGSFQPSRAQGVFVGEAEVKRIVGWLKGQGKPDYLQEIIEVQPLEESGSKAQKKADQDELFEDAKQLIISTQYASTSYLQRKLRIGYNRAARIMDQLEESGVIAEYVGEKKRAV